jgi:FkbM family methyltransferase
LSSTSHSAELDDLFAEDPAEATRRLGALFDRAAGDAKDRIVLCGAGTLGRRTLRALRSVGCEPLAMVDNKPQLWRTEVEGLGVLPPQEAVARYGGSAVFVVTIFNHAAVRRQLAEMGCPLVVSFPSLFWKHGGAFLPYYSLGGLERVFAEREAIAAALDLWDDELSRDYYLSQLRWRMKLDSDDLPPPCPAQDVYFPDDLLRPRDDEAFVDCGAFDGDSVRAFIARRDGRFREIVAMEPDPRNFARLTDFVQGCDAATRRRIVLLRLAAASYNGRLPFEAQGDVSSSAAAVGSPTVPCARLDDLLAGRSPTFIKMDVEGAEIDALEGARGIVAAHRPVLAVCAYHEPSDLWRIPRAIKALDGGYRLFLRRYAEDCWEIVCYAVPQERLAS